ncbi:MAG: sodium/proline symporter [Planctomycetes bacterium]|nr:sodium/proline symporter [Planctomycetota bacterium]
MERSTAILLALAAYLLALLGLAWFAKTRTRDAAGFYLGGRTLGPWVAALAANASSSSAWSLVGVSGFACREGLAALWLLPGCLGGFLLNWLVVAPRLRAATGEAITLTEFLAGPPGTPGRSAVAIVASVLTLGCLCTYVAAQMQAAGPPFVRAFATTAANGIVLGAAVTIAYTLLGGYLAVSITDTLQGLVMVLVAVVVPAAAVLHFGGVAGFVDAVGRVPAPSFTTAFGGREGLVAVGFALGLCGIGLGYPGQPHAVNKYMGMAPGASMAVARTVGIAWAVVLYTGMVVLGLAARAAWGVAAADSEAVLYLASERLFPPLVDGLVLAAVLAAIMSTVDSQLLVCASCVTHDLRLGRGPFGLLAAPRVTVLVVGGLATTGALLLPQRVFDRVLFAWAALGSAFGPLLLVRLCRGPVRPGWALTSIAIGGLGAIAGSFFTVLGPGFADRVLSWAAAGWVAWTGNRRASRA